MFDIDTIRRMNASRVGAGRAEAMTRDQVADSYGVQRADVTRAANNSWKVQVRPDEVAYVHIKTEVVRTYPSGAVKLRSGGWETVTTKDRLNSFQHVARVYSDRGRWIVRVYGGGLYAFQTGMVIDNGRAFNNEGNEMERLPEGSATKAARLGNAVTEALELWGGLSGYWENGAKWPEDSALFKLMDKIEAEGLERTAAWDLMDPHVRGEKGV